MFVGREPTGIASIALFLRCLQRVPEGRQMGILQRFGESYRKRLVEPLPPEICEICGGVMDVDPESGERHCPVCDNPDL